MHIDQWLDLEQGRTTATAERFGVSVSAVSQWRTTGVPVRLWRLMAEWTQGQVSVDEMLAIVESKHPTKEAA